LGAVPGGATVGASMASPPRRGSPEPLFPRLAGGRGAPSPERAAAHRRGRLEGAMVEAVRRHGYPQTTIAELVGLAGVSKRDFYESFASKEDCFLSTFDQIVEQAVERVGQAYSAEDGIRERLMAALGEFAAIVASETAAAHLVIVDSLSLGAATVAAQARAAERFEGMVSASLEESAAGEEISELAIRGVVGGIRNTIYRALRTGRPEALRERVEELVDWVLGYRGTDGAGNDQRSIGARLVAAVSAESAPSAPGGGQLGLAWEEPASSARSRAELPQRERIMRAAAQVAVERGYRELSIPTISAAAAVSNQTFYKHFNSKQEAFLAAFDALTLRSFEATAEAFGAWDGWLEAGAAGVAALLQCFVDQPLFRGVSFFELPAAGPEALDRAEAMLDVFTIFLRPESLPPGVQQRPPEAVVEAVAGGLWTIVQVEIVAGRVESLPRLAPEMIDFMLVPFGLA
jgi:AcrR family transcriptional regulator